MHKVWGVPILLGVLYIAWLFVGKFGAGICVDFLQNTVFTAYINPFAIRAANWLPLGSFVRGLLVGPYGVITMALTYAIAIAVVSGAVLISSMLSIRRIRRLDLVHVLKSRE